MIDRICHWVWTLRWATWAVVAAVAVGLTWRVPPIEFDQSIEGFFPDEHAGLADYAATRRLFGDENMVFVAYEDAGLWSPDGMNRLAELAAELGKDTEGVERVESMDSMPLPWRVDEAVESLVSARWTTMLGKFLAARATVGDAFRFAGNEPERNETLRRRICGHPLFEGLMVDSAGTMTTVIVSLRDARKVDHKAVIRRIRATADDFAARHGFRYAAVAGPPVLFSDGFVSLEEDNRVLGVVAMALMALTMFAAVRNPGWALLPLVAGWTTWQLVRWMLWYFDLRLTLSSGPIVAQTVVLCMPPAAHLAMRFRERLKSGDAPALAAQFSLADALVPVAWCAATAASGYFAGWVASSVRPISQFGLTMAVSNLAAGFLAFALSSGSMGLAALLSRNRRVVADAVVADAVVADAVVAHAAVADAASVGERPSMDEGHAERSDQPASAGDPTVARTHVVSNSADAGGVGRGRGGLVSRLTRWVVAHPQVVALAFLVPGLLAATGIRRLSLESNYINIFRPSSRVAVDYRRAEAKLGGIGLIEVVLPAPETPTVAWLRDVASAAAEVKAIDPRVVSQVFSLADLLLPHDDEGMLPEVIEGVVLRKRQFLQIPKFRYLLDRIWNEGQRTTRLIVRIQESAPAEQKDELLHRLDAWAADRTARAGRTEPAAVSPSAAPRTYVTGLSYLMTQITQAMISTSFRSAGWSSLLILLMLWLALRHFPLAVAALLPTFVAVGLVLGVMGWLGLKIDMSTALVAAVAIGLSVDDTFHCLLHWQEELRHGRDPREALLVSYATSGPGVILGSAAVTLGFLAMIFSQFVPMMNFGWLVAVATLGGSMGNLIALPAVLSLVAPAARRWTGWRAPPR